MQTSASLYLTGTEAFLKLSFSKSETGSRFRKIIKDSIGIERQRHNLTDVAHTADSTPVWWFQD